MSGKSTTSILRVAQSGPADARTITEAIRKASPGQVIQVFPGIYRESIVLDRDLELVGQNAYGAVVIESIGAPCMDMKTERSVIRNFTIRGAIGSAHSSLGPNLIHYGIVVLQGNLVLEGCDISVDDGPAIYIKGQKLNAPIQQVIDLIPSVHYLSLFSPDDLDLTGKDEILFSRESSKVLVTIRNCQIHDSEIGVFIRQKAQVLIEACDFFHHSESAISASLKPELVANHCTIQNSYRGITLSNFVKGDFEDCVIQSTRYPIVFIDISSVVFRRCVFQNLPQLKQNEFVKFESCQMI